MLLFSSLCDAVNKFGFNIFTNMTCLLLSFPSLHFLLILTQFSLCVWKSEEWFVFLLTNGYSTSSRAHDDPVQGELSGNCPVMTENEPRFLLDVFAHVNKNN